jgi:hypothetical protein
MRWLLAAVLCLCSSVAAAQTPTPFAVELEGPSDGTGGFMVFVTKPAAGIARAKHDLPSGAAYAELTDNSGRTVWVFINPKPGRYAFHLSVQLPTVASKDNPTGLDPFAEDSLVVTVGGVTPSPPVVVDPANPPVGPDVPPVDPNAPAITAAVYVYEKDESPVPSAVMAALNRINRDSKGKIVATLLERDTTNNVITTPAQYLKPLAAAKEAGLPSLVIMADSTIVRVVKAPTTEAQVLEAVK